MTAKSAATLKAQFQSTDPQDHNNDLVDSAMGSSGVPLSADAEGRARMAAGFFDAATALDKFAADSLTNAVLLDAIQNGAFVADDTTRALFAANFLGATAVGRALMQTGLFDAATVLDKFGVDSFTNAVLLQLIQNGAFLADANTRALFADDIWTTSKIGKLNGAPLGSTNLFTIGVEGGNVINVAIQLKDGLDADLAVRGAIKAYLSGDANGDSLLAVAPTGGCAIGTDGLLIPDTPALVDALIVHGNLAIDATAEKFKTTQAAAYVINGVSHVKAATIELVFSAAHVITASKFGVILVQIDSAGNVSTKVPASPQAYNDAPTALAALPATDAGKVALGYIAIENNAGDWTANTDDLTNGSDVTTAAFTDGTEIAIDAPKSFTLVSEADGDIDINITEVGVKTMYLALVLPNGKLAVSGAITFA